MPIKAQINRTLHTKTSEKFYVSFHQLPENISNILGRDVQISSRPVFTFNEYEIRNKGIKHSGGGRIEYQPIDINFIDDTESLVNYALYEQIKRQSGTSPIAYSNALFEIQIKIYNANGVAVEIITLKYCRIQSISHSEHVYADSTNNITTASIAFNECDYAFPIIEQS